MEIKKIRFVGSAASWQQLPHEGLPEVAFVGRSNVGKSSLINMLAGRRNLARTSSTPGKTRTFNCYEVNGQVYFQDLPGLGYARVSRALRNQWLSLIAGYLEHRTELQVVVQLIDSRHAPMAQDRLLLQAMRQFPVAHLIVLTKADKLSSNQRQKSLQQVNEVLFECGIHAPVTLSSAKTRLGKVEVLAQIGAALEAGHRGFTG